LNDASKRFFLYYNICALSFQYGEIKKKALALQVLFSIPVQYRLSIGVVLLYAKSQFAFLTEVYK